MTARAVGGYARVRSQFKMAVGKFEGVEEALTRIGAYTYMMDATRKMTAGAVDTPRRITTDVEAGVYYPSHDGVAPRRWSGPLCGCA